MGWLFPLLWLICSFALVGFVAYHTTYHPHLLLPPPPPTTVLPAVPYILLVHYVVGWLVDVYSFPPLPPATTTTHTPPHTFLLPPPTTYPHYHYHTLFCKRTSCSIYVHFVRWFTTLSFVSLLPPPTSYMAVFGWVRCARFPHHPTTHPTHTHTTHAAYTGRWFVLYAFLPGSSISHYRFVSLVVVCCVGLL